MKTIGIKWWRLLLGLAAVLLLVTAAWSVPLQQGALSGGRNWAAVRGEVVTSVFKVDNLSCAVCLDTICRQLQNMQGTVGLEADLANQVVFVDHQREVDSNKIAEEMTTAGFPARWLGSGRKIRTTTSIESVPESVDGWSGCNRRACGATAKEWKELFQRYFGK